MASFTTPVSEYMTTPIITVGPTAAAEEADRLLHEQEISALGVRDEAGRLVGVVSRTDLLDSSSGESGETFRIADAAVSELMTADPITVPETTPLDQVARLMLDKHIHRVFVERNGDAIGVVSTRDLMRAVYDKRVRTPSIDFATRSVVKIEGTDSIALAIDRLERSNKHGLIVVDEDWPIGTFAQRDALEARAHDPRTNVEDVMNLRILVVPAPTPIYRAAQQAMAMNVRRILLVDDAIVGVVSTFDFARVVK